MLGSWLWGWRGGEWTRELGLGFNNPVGTGGVLDMCMCFGCGGVGGVGGEWVGCLDQGRERWFGVMSVWGVSLDYLCRWQVQVSVYCAWRIPAHLRCTQCSILLHLMDICFLSCICLWQISQIQTCLFKVVGPGLVSTSSAFVRSSAIHQEGPHGWHAQKWYSVPHCWGGKVRHNLHYVTAPLLVCCVVWSHSSFPSSLHLISYFSYYAMI